MKARSLFFALSLSLLFACARTHYYEHQMLSALPTQPHNNEVDIFYEGESQPKQDYLEYYDLRLVRKGVHSDKHMLTLLKAEAKKKGLDGVTDVAVWLEEEETTTFADLLLSLSFPDDPDNTTIIDYKVIAGRGIRYIKNIDLTKSVKTGKVYDLDKNLLIGEIKYLPDGLMSETISEDKNAEIFMDTYYNLSDDHLLREEKQWQTLHHTDGRIDVRRKYHPNSELLARVRVKYHTDLTQQIKHIRFMEKINGSPQNISKIKYEYNDKHQVIKRIIMGNSPTMTQEITYQDDLIHETNIRFQGKRYKIVYDFYQQSDLEHMIIKAEEVETTEIGK